MISLGRARQRVDLEGARSADEAVARVRAYAERHPEQYWILGRGWNQELWPEATFPTAAMLDEVVPNRPVWLGRVDGHAAWANSLAMNLAKITDLTPDPEGGRIVKDANGQPQGVFVDRAEALVAKHVAAPSYVQDRAAMKLAMQELVSLGITGVHDAGIDARELSMYRAMASQNQLPLRIYGMLSEHSRHLLDAPIIGEGYGRLTVRSVKLYADGALGSRGAALLQPYQDEPSHSGLAFFDDKAINALVEGVVARGFQVNVHAIGDAANRQVLNAFAQAQGRHPSLVHRNRIEHAQVVHPQDIASFRTLGIIAAMQPIHATSDMHMAEKRLAASALEGAYAWQRFLDAGVVIAAGSDFPVEPANPFWGIYAALTRADASGKPEGGWIPDQRLSMEQTLCAFTRDAAFAAFEENEVGRLAEGQAADFILVDVDPFKAHPSAVRNTKVSGTWVGGTRVFTAQP